MNVYSLLCNERIAMIDKCMMVLQICLDSLKAEPGLDSETCHDGSHIIDMKVEEVTVDEHPVLITFPAVKAEQEVCLYSALFTFHRCTNCLLPFSSLSVHPYETAPFW
jgi:hypothetical protein